MANEQNLIPLNKRSKEDAKRIRSMGGKAHKGLAKYKITTCKSCKLPCPLKDQGTEERWKCQIPDGKRILLEAFADPSKLNSGLFQALMELNLMATTYGEKERFFNAYLNFKKEIQPTEQFLNVKQVSVGLSYKDLKQMYDASKNNKRRVSKRDR